MAGRTRQKVTDDYVVYAKDAVAAERISTWLAEEMAAFGALHETSSDSQGLVFAIEPEVELSPAVEQWRKRHVVRSRPIQWTSPIRSQFFSSPYGRPYCLSKKPYFVDSFEIPPDDAMVLGVVPKSASPAWVCFLTTDEDVTTTFDITLRDIKKKHAKRVSHEVPLAVRLLSLPATVLSSAAAESMIYPRWRSIDVKLMRLQRRETLRRAFIGLSTRDSNERKQELLALQDEFDKAWKQIWVRRPFD